MATPLDPALAKRPFTNWLKGALAVLFAREGLTEFVQNEISDFQRNLLQSIFIQNAIPSGTLCSACTTANLLKCPTEEFCGRKRPCKLHDPLVQNKTPSQKCHTNVCHHIKDAILNHHRFHRPTWEITDATRWCSDPFEIAKCYLPPKGYCCKKYLVEIDFIGTLGIIINNTIFQNKLAAHLNITPNICSKVRDVINEKVRYSSSFELSDVELAQIIDALRDLLQDPKILLQDQHAKDAVSKLNQLQNNTLIISAGDIAKVLEENVRENITKQQRDALQDVQTYFDAAQTSMLDLELIKSSTLDEMRNTADDKRKKERLHLSQQQHTHNDDTLVNDFKEDLMTYYAENESMIPAAPLVDEHKVPIEDLYVLPHMWAYDKPLNFGLVKNAKKGEQTPGSGAQEKRKTTFSQLFLSEQNVRYRKIYITADAGFGKTTLSQKIAMTWCQAHSPLESLTENYNGEDLAAMKYFDFLFLLHLRDYQCEPRCNLDDLIMQMLLNNLSRNTQYTKEFLQRQLHYKKCLILLDGLDEWSHPDKCKRTPAIPHNNHPDSCTVLTTSRPWKLGTIRLSEHNIDRHIAISELDWLTRDELQKNAVRILNERNLNLAGKNIADFDREIKLVQIGDIIYIPYILLQLICLFFGGFPIGKSKCDIYSKITEFTLDRGLNKKDLPDMHVESKVPVPNCMKENKTCDLYFSLLMKLRNLAFYNLFNEKKEASLIFDRRIVNQYMTEKEIEFCLKVGLLCQTKDSSIIAKRQYTVSFQHKSVQEFFSAIYITSECQNESVKSTILKVCSSLSSTLEMENLFVFVCGINPELYTCISGELQKIFDLDNSIGRYITFMYNVDNDEPDYYNDSETMKSYQSMQLQCLQESLRNGNNSCPIPLYFVLDKHSLTYDVKALKSIMQFNKSNGESLRVSLQEKIVAFMLSQNLFVFMQSQDSGTLTSLEKLRIENCREEPVWLAEIISESACTLKCLPLSGRSSLSGVSITALTGLQCLQLLYFCLFYMTHSNLKCLYAYISKTTTLTQLKLKYVRCLDHHPLYRNCDVTLDLHPLNKLKMLLLPNVPCKELHVNPACLEKLEFWPRREMIASARGALWQDLREAPVLSSLMLYEMTCCQAMIQTIFSIKQLQFLKLEQIDTGDVIPHFSTAMTKLERVELVCVTMSSTVWKELSLSVGQLSRTITFQLSLITMTSQEWEEVLLSVGGLPHSVTVELRECKGPSSVEWQTIINVIKSTSSLTLLPDLLVDWLGASLAVKNNRLVCNKTTVL